jgi:hypothetical protein
LKAKNDFERLQTIKAEKKSPPFALFTFFASTSVFTLLTAVIFAHPFGTGYRTFITVVHFTVTAWRIAGKSICTQADQHHRSDDKKLFHFDFFLL